ncbi:arsenate reductase family protein [uncultured Psychroserpens sp.]|uniref:arsenate reductase family protein n=1 Tax=uncultured Psychroserpens sp. TaxID=255436 RepID=UPI0026293BC8|nr:ArsC/Spx/MgsR family protein [uncultured Psychroserpens sp.]
MIKIYYSSSSSIGKQTYSYANASYKDLLVIDVTKTKVTGTVWKDLAEQMNLEISDLIDKEHPTYITHYNSNTQLTENDWIKVLQAHPEVLVYPIVIFDDKKYLQIKNPSDIQHLLDPNSEGIDEKKHF